MGGKQSSQSVMEFLHSKLDAKRVTELLAEHSLIAKNINGMISIEFRPGVTPRPLVCKCVVATDGKHYGVIAQLEPSERCCVSVIGPYESQSDISTSATVLAFGG